MKITKDIFKTSNLDSILLICILAITNPILAILHTTIETALILSLLDSLIFFVLYFRHKVKKYHQNTIDILEKNFIKLVEDNTKITSGNTAIKDYIQKMFEILDNSTSIKIIKSDIRKVKQSEFYSEIKSTLIKSQKKVDLMYLEDYVPEKPTESIDEKRIYFEAKRSILCKKFDKAEKTGDILFKGFEVRQIVSIENMKKLNWVKRMIDDYKDYDGFTLKCVGFSESPNKQLNRDKIEGLSVQIIDGNKIFLVSKSRGREKDSSDIISTNCELIESLQRYFDQIWGQSITIFVNKEKYLNESGIPYLDAIEKFLNNNN